MRFRVLGPVEVIDQDLQIPIPATRVRTLLALLLLRPNQIVGSDVLVDSLWEVAELPANPRSALQTYVSRLRTMLGAEGRNVISSEATGYSVRVVREQLDLLEFRAVVGQALATPDDPVTRVRLLSEALSLWRGEPLTGVPGVPLVRDNVAYLTEERMYAAEQLIAARLELDQHSEVIGPLAALVHQWPLRERPWALMIRALYRSGRQADALDAYQRVRAILRDQLGVGPGVELEGLHRAILAGSDDRAHPIRPSSHAPLASSSGTAPVIHDLLSLPPRQLPADLDRFTGREGVLAALDSLLPSDDPSDSRPTVIAAIDGTAGVGKTALAIHWAHRVKARFSDGQLYVNLRGHGPENAMEPGDAIEVMLRSLGVPADQVPGSLDVRSGLLRTLLAGKHMLVLLDNARDADQVRPLLPGAGSLVLITSRCQLRGLAAREGAFRLTLDLLTENESVELLVRFMGVRAHAELDAVRTLARLCGGLTLPLALAAERATREQDSMLAELVEDLRDKRDRLDALSSDDDRISDLRGVFAWSYCSLSVDAARLFRLLGIAPGPDIGTFAAAALAGVSTARAQRLLDQLVQANMVQRRQPGRFEIHDLLRTYAIELADKHDADRSRDAAVRRLLDWYCRTAFEARRFLQPSETSVELRPAQGHPVPLTFRCGPDALAWYGAERQNLIAAIRLAHEVGCDDLCWRLAFGLWIHSHTVGAWDAIIDLHGLALRSARRLGDLVAEAHVLTGLGAAHRGAGRLDVALKVQSEALELFRELNAPAGEATALSNLCAVFRELGRYEESITAGRAAYALDRAHDEPGNMSVSLYQVARTLTAAGRCREARAAAAEAASLCRKLGNSRGLALALQILAIAELELGEHCLASEHGGEASAILEDLGAPEVPGLAKVNA